jgi:hypothetical protein
MTRRTAPFYDDQLAREADELVHDVVRRFVSDETNLAGKRFAAVVASPAGAGKSYLVTTVAGAAAASTQERGGTIAIGTPTNDQAYGLVESIATRFPDTSVAFVPATGRALPHRTAARPNVSQVKAVDAGGFPIIVATLDKLGDASSRGDLPSFRYLCIDEAYQGDAAKYFKVGDVASRHLLVGDPGQLDPFTTIDDPGRWKGLDEDPTQTAVQVLLRNHPMTALYQMPITRRLSADAVPVVEAFYPGHPFRAWTLPGARRTKLVPSIGRGKVARLDATLELAAAQGWAWLQLPGTPVLTADPTTIQAIISLIKRLRDRSPELASERTGGKWEPLQPSRLAVAVSHNDQKDFMRAALDQTGLHDVRVDTANKLQGLEFDFVVAWHPLAGLPEADGFHLDPGRLCVMLTRHRHGCIVVGRASDPELVTELPPTSDVWLGHDPDPVLDGWFAHSLVFDRLEPVAVDL